MTDVKDQEEGGQAWPQIENLLQIQNEVSYVIECLAEGCRAEAARGMKDAYNCLEKHCLPRSCVEQIETMLDEAVAPQWQRSGAVLSQDVPLTSPVGESGGFLLAFPATRWS